MSKITTLEHLKAVAEAAKTFASGLVGELAQTTTEAIVELESVKADRASAVSFTIPTSGWSSDSDADYPNYYDIAVTGLAATDRAEIAIAPDSLDAAKACGLCPTNETQAGIIRIRSTSVPAEKITAEYWIEDGKES